MKAVLQEKLERKERKKAERQKSGAPEASGLAPSLDAPSKKGPLPPQSQKRSLTTTTSSPDAPASKRVKSHAVKASRTGGDARMAEEREKEQEKEPASELNVPWMPSFITPDKKQILKSDILHEDPSLAFTLQSGLMLLRDIVAPLTLKSALNDYYFYAGRVSHFP